MKSLARLVVMLMAAGMLMLPVFVSNALVASACGTYTQQNYHDDSAADLDEDDHSTEWTGTVNGFSGTVETDFYLFSDGCNNHYYRMSVWEEGFSGHWFNMSIKMTITIHTDCNSSTQNTYTDPSSSSTYMYSQIYYQPPYNPPSGCGPWATAQSWFTPPGHTQQAPGFQENEGDGSPL